LKQTTQPLPEISQSGRPPLPLLLFDLITFLISTPHQLESSIEANDAISLGDQPQQNMISTNTAKRVYKLNDDDLKDIPFDSFRNPLFKKEARMHLYVEADILDAVQRKADAEAEKKKLKQEKENKKEEDRREKKKQDRLWRLENARIAEAKVDAFPRNIFPAQGHQQVSQANVSAEILCQIAEHVAGSYEHIGIRGVGLVAKDLIALRLSHSAFQVAAEYGLQKLADRIKEIAPFPLVPGLADPQKLVSNPTSIKRKLMKEVLKVFGHSTQGTKQSKLLS
jgi:hypothetical protein